MIMDVAVLTMRLSMAVREWCYLRLLLASKVTHDVHYKIMLLGTYVMRCPPQAESL